MKWYWWVISVLVVVIIGIIWLVYEATNQIFGW